MPKMGLRGEEDSERLLKSFSFHFFVMVRINALIVCDLLWGSLRKDIGRVSGAITSRDQI